ncbi:MAG TPA: winged helix-turn-helix domain-containing protein [Burkholderiaceae bacterium]
MFIAPVQLPPGELTPPRTFDDPPPPSARIVLFGGCELRLGQRELLVDGVRRHVQPRPFDLLLYLIEHGDRVVTREELLSRVWSDGPVQPCSLPAAVLRLRRALGKAHRDAIRTYQRVGYRFTAQAAFLKL